MAHHGLICLTIRYCVDIMRADANMLAPISRMMTPSSSASAVVETFIDSDGQKGRIKMSSDIHEIRFVIFPENGGYSAVCLEHYMGAQGNDMTELTERLKTVYRAYLDDAKDRMVEPFSDLPPAPDEYHEMWRDLPPGATRGHIGDKNAYLQLAA